MISVLIPTYNERENVAQLAAALDKALKAEHEILFIDDASPDGTAGEIRRMMAQNPTVRLVERESKLGLTGAIRAGLDASRGEIVVVMDADLSHPAEVVPLLIQRLEGSDIAIGTRQKVESWPAHRRIISAGADAIARVVLGVRASDPLSGFFAARRELLQATRFRTKGYKLLLNILADNPRASVAEVPYTFRDRHAGTTKLGAAEMLNYVFDIIRIKSPGWL